MSVKLYRELRGLSLFTSRMLRC